MLLENKVAVVTGGSRGIGYAIVEGFLAEGASVILCASRQETADKAVAKLKESNPDAPVEAIWPDLSDYQRRVQLLQSSGGIYGSAEKRRNH